MSALGILDGRLVRSTFKNGMERTLAETSARELAHFTGSDSAFEEHGVTTTTPQMERLVNGVTKRSTLDAHKVVISNEEWGRQLEVKRKDWERADDPQTMIRDKMMGFGQRVGQLPGKIISQLMLDGLTELAFDGVEFYADASGPHLNGDGASLVNALSTSEIPELVVTDEDDITVEEFTEAVLAGVQHMRGFQDDSGAPVNDIVAKWLVEVPTGLYKVMTRASRQNRINGGDSNVLLDALNASAEPGETFRFRSNPWLTGAAAQRFWIHAVDGEGGDKPFIFQEEVKPEIEILDRATDLHGWTTRRSAIVDAYWRGNGGFAHYRKSGTFLFAES